jgi:trehalose 6-phosphate synthase
VRAGGLEVALRATLKRHDCVWLGWSGDVKPKDEVETRTMVRGGITYIVTDLAEDDFQEYYNGYANRVLWPILHYRLDLAEFSRRDLSGYFRVNQHFADELDKVLEPDDVVWVHDYHLLPLAKALRERGRENRIGFFLHIPFPPPEFLTAMPGHERLIPALGQYDLVGFQTDGDGANFARYLANECGMPAHIVRGPQGDARAMRIGTFPVGVETRELEETAKRSMATAMVQKAIKSMPGEAIIGVDRLDYSKGINLRIDAFEQFLMSRPDWRGRVTYLQITPKSRSDIHEYSEMEHQLEAAAGRINGHYGDVSWTPVRYVNKAYSRNALAGLFRAARVGLVTPLRDGMNLVAKEYVASQDADDPGVLILSRFAGAAAEFGNAALPVNPYDSEAVGAAIARALEMPLAERRERHQSLFAALLRNDISTWGDRFLAELAPNAFGPDKKAVPPAGRTPERVLAKPEPSPKSGAKKVIPVAPERVGREPRTRPETRH